VTARIPRFKSREEEAEFWDTHDTTEFEDEFEEVQIKGARPLGHILAVRLDGRTIARLGAEARKKGVGASTLARMWLLERLEQESARSSRVADRPRPRSARTPAKR
jgi:hypothetical protein